VEITQKMVSNNPFDQFRMECQAVLVDALAKAYPENQQSTIKLNKTPNIELGQLASSVSFELAKKLKMKPLDAAKKLVSVVDESKFDLIEKVTTEGLIFTLILLSLLSLL